MNPKVAIIYLCYNDLRYVPEVVESWQAQDYSKDRISIVMIPNGAKDGVQDLIKAEILPRSKKDLPEVIMIDDGKNRGFASGNNLGVEWAIENNFDYVFLNNGDLKLDPNAIFELVKIMESDENIGSAQSLVMHWKEPERVNVSGGMFHIAGYGYARDNGKHISEISIKDREQIMYSSGAAVMYRIDALKKVGLLEEGFFMYHEDLELGLRLRFAGYKNVLAKYAISFHDYSFSRNPKKFQWMEIYRYIVMLSYFKLRTLIVIYPILQIVECGSWILSVKGGWFSSKLKANLNFLLPRTWRLLWKMRTRAQRLRTKSDRDLLSFATLRIEDQETNSMAMKIGNKIIETMWRVTFPLIK